MKAIIPGSQRNQLNMAPCLPDAPKRYKYLPGRKEDGRAVMANKMKEYNRGRDQGLDMAQFCMQSRQRQRIAEYVCRGKG